MLKTGDLVVCVAPKVHGYSFTGLWADDTEDFEHDIYPTSYIPGAQASEGFTTMRKGETGIILAFSVTKGPKDYNGGTDFNEALILFDNEYAWYALDFFDPDETCNVYTGVQNEAKKRPTFVLFDDFNKAV